MKIGIVTTAYALAAATHELIDTALRGGRHEREIHLFLHSGHAHVRATCEHWAKHEAVIYYPYGTNRGLANSWNEGILAAYYDALCDVVLVVNDDIIFAEGDVDTLAEYAVAHRENYIVSCRGWNHGLGKHDSIGYSCFAINPIALKTIGVFDQNFSPIYYEDNDYTIRATIAGLSEGHCADTKLEHGGSATIRFAGQDYRQQHNRTFEANKRYYMRKWGGEPGKETYRTPFNVPWMTVYIGPEKRDAPYGEEFDRTDLAIVEI